MIELSLHISHMVSSTFVCFSFDFDEKLTEFPLISFLGTVAKSNSFYASLHAGLASQGPLQDSSPKSLQDTDERLATSSIAEWKFVFFSKL